MIDGTRSSFSSMRNLEVADSMNDSSSSILSYLNEEFDLNEDSAAMTPAQAHQRYHYYSQERHDYLSSNSSTSIHTSGSTTRRKQQGREVRRNSHLSAIEPVFDEKKIQELLDLVGSINTDSEL